MINDELVFELFSAPKAVIHTSLVHTQPMLPWYRPTVPPPAEFSEIPLKRTRRGAPPNSEKPVPNPVEMARARELNFYLTRRLPLPAGLLRAALAARRSSSV